MSADFDALLILAGPDFDRLSFQALCGEIFLLAVDGGLNHLQNYSGLVDLHLGDMDSFVAADNLPVVKNTLQVAAEKDDSDCRLALHYLQQHGYRRIAVFGSCGGRNDHQIQFLETAVDACADGVEITAFNTADIICFSTGEIRFSGLTAPRTISVFAGTEACTGVTYSGLKYPLDNYTLRRSHPLGLSNLSVSDEVIIQHQTGVLIAILNKK